MTVAIRSIVLPPRISKSTALKIFKLLYGINNGKKCYCPGTHLYITAFTNMLRWFILIITEFTILLHLSWLWPCDILYCPKTSQSQLRWKFLSCYTVSTMINSQSIYLSTVCWLIIFMTIMTVVTRTIALPLRISKSTIYCTSPKLLKVNCPENV